MGWGGRDGRDAGGLLTVPAVVVGQPGCPAPWLTYPLDDIALPTFGVARPRLTGSDLKSASSWRANGPVHPSEANLELQPGSAIHVAGAPGKERLLVRYEREDRLRVARAVAAFSPREVDAPKYTDEQRLTVHRRPG